MNKEEILKVISDYKKIIEIATEVGKIHGTLHGKHISKSSIDEIDIDEVDVNISFDAASGCSCCYNIEYISFPTDYLWDINWKEQELKRIEISKKNFEEEKKQKEAKRIADQEKREKEQYERLKTKFEI